MAAAHRTGGGKGMLVIDLRIPGFGFPQDRFRLSARTHRVTTLKRRKALVQQCAELGQGDVLRALRSGDLAWEALEEAARKGRLADASLAADLRLKANLAEAIDRTLPRMGPTEITRERYRVALAGLWMLGFDRATSTVADLRRDREDWTEALATWPASNATKNNVRTAVSRFLTRFLGTVHHPFRLEVLHEDRWRKLSVAKRVKGFDHGEFWPLMALVPERAIPSYVVLAASGMRVGEYLHPAIRVDEAHHVIHTVGKTGPKTYAVDASAWAYVHQAIPCRVSRMTKSPTRLQNDPRYRRLYVWIRKAGEALGLRISPHDLRRLYVRLGVEAKGQVATQHAVGHETPAMTAEYARWRNQQDVATAVAEGLGLAGGADAHSLGSGKKSGKSKRIGAD